MTPPVLHAGLVARRFTQGWRGALLRGPSGIGKSELALRALDAGWRLVADDRVVVWASGGRLFGRAPPTIGGLIEVRHVEVVRRAVLPFAAIAVLVDLCAELPERLPEPQVEICEGVRLPRYDLPGRSRGGVSRLAAVLALAASDRALWP